MPASQMARIMQHLRKSALLRDEGGLTDAEFLGAFVAHHDEVAFEALVRRHGPMVLGVCRRLLGNGQDAEDAFQATFLVLVRKAASVGSREAVGNWLYGVAYRTGLAARRARYKRNAKEKQVMDMPHPQVELEETWQELQPLLDQELANLPDKYRLPVVLCDLESRTRKAVARELKIPEGTLSNRLASARKMLAKRLTNRGITLSGGAIAAILSQNAASAGVPASLIGSTVKAAIAIAAGGTAAAVSSAKVAVLFERMMRMMLLRKLNAVAGLVMLAVLGLGLGVCLCQVQAQDQPPVASQPNPGQQAPKPGGKEAAKEGRIYFHLDNGMATVQPDGKDTKHLPGISQNDIFGFQSHTARLSPDGKRLAFGKAVYVKGNGILSVNPPDKIYVQDLARGGDGELVAEIPGASMNEWYWSPDGTKLAITWWDGPNSLRNWVLDLKTKKLDLVKMPRFKFKDKEYTMAIQAWSPDGGWFLASGDELFLVKTDGSGAKRLTKSGINLMSGHCRFSPDGCKVLFVGVANKLSMKLYVVEVPGGKTRAVVDVLNFTDVHACWSPDGKRIAYSATLLDANGERDGETSLFAIDADGNNTTTVRTEKHEPRLIRLQLSGWR